LATVTNPYAVETNPAPEGYPPVIPYLIIPNAEGFLPLMQHIFGAEEVMTVRLPDGSLMHGELRIGPSVIMYAEASPEWPAQPAGLFVYVPSADEAYARALATGCVSIMPVEDKEYGRTCGFRDPHGNTWWPTAKGC
jgi:uncharacterized glyoxalase superfamily protein PhnB